MPAARPGKTVGSEIKRDDSMTMLTAIPRPATARPPIYARGVARSQLAGVLTLGLAILVGQMLAAPALPMLEPDSASYLAFASYRPSGYALLLRLSLIHI